LAMKTGSRVASQRDTSKKRESIVKAAIQAFQVEGYDRASMDRIAEASGASKRTVYNHFPSKEALFQAALAKIIDELVAIKSIPYDSARGLEEQLEAIADAETAATENSRWLGFMKVIASVFIRDPEQARIAAARYLAGGSGLADWLRQASSDGRIAAPEPELAALVFSAMMSGAFIWPAVIYGQTFEAPVAEALKRELVRTFLCRYAV
jgi:TetR/AcrR family transcriptional regulator, regulator of autoinduction and epiphytic fitness